MRVLQVHNSYRERGGEDTIVQTEAEMLTAAGHDVVQYLTTNPSGAISAGLTLSTPSWNSAAVSEVRDVAERVVPDLAHVHNTWYTLTPRVFRVLSRLGIPTVMTVHNFRLVCANASLSRNGGPCLDCVGTHPWRGVVHRCYRGSVVASARSAASITANRIVGTWAKYVDRYVVATSYLGDMLADNGVPGDRIQVIPMSVPDPGRRTAPPSEANTVLLVGRLDAYKGTREFLETWREANSAFELRIIGDGPERASLESMDLSNVRFLGWLEPEDVRREMLAARALVFPSKMIETFGLGIAEAFAAEIPVIANRIGTRPDVVGSIGAGRLVDTREKWIEAIADLEDGSAVDRAGSVARQRYLDEFSPSSNLRRLVGVYQGLIGAQSSP